MEERALAAIEARLQRLAGEFDSRRQGHSAKKASRGGGSGGSGGGGGGGSSSPDRYTGRAVPPPQLAPAKPALEPEPEPPADCAGLGGCRISPSSEPSSSEESPPKISRRRASADWLASQRRSPSRTRSSSRRRSNPR